MTQLQEQQLPAWVDLAIIAVVFVIFVMKLLAYNGQLEIRAATLTLAELIGISFSIGAIVIALVIAHFQDKQTKKMDKIISSTHIREQNVKVEVLRRVLRNTNSVRFNLNRIRSLIDDHIEDSNKHPWEKVRGNICWQIRRAGERRDEIKVDIAIIITLINDSRLFTTFDEEYLSPVFRLLDHIVSQEFSVATENLQTTREALREHRLRLDQPKAWIQAEMRRGGAEEENI